MTQDRTQVRLAEKTLMQIKAVAAECGWSLSTTKRRIAQAQERVLKAMGS